MKTKLFFDTEFTGLRQQTDLISIGIISEDGQSSFYGEFTDYSKADIGAWLQENVLNNLLLRDHEAPFIKSEYEGKVFRIKGNSELIKFNLTQWLKQFDEVEIWSDCLAFDWVLFCQIWGGAFFVPNNVYYIPFDICTLMKIKNVDPDVKREEFCGLKEIDGYNKHNALWDAMVIAECYKNLMKL